MNPISPTGPNASPAAALFEAVVRYSSAGELRDQQNRASAPPPSDDAREVPTDESILGPDEEAPAPDAGAGRADILPHAETGHAAEGAAHHPTGDAEGRELQQEALLARQAADQHGRQEARRDSQVRLQRSTREMMKMDAAAEPAETEKAPSRLPVSRDRPPDDAGSADVSSPATTGALPTAAGAAPHPGGDLAAAAVGSGIHHLPEERSSGRPIERDMDAEQVDGSLEATGTRSAHAASRSRSGSSLQSSLSFDGEPEGEGRDPARGGAGRSTSGGGSSQQGEGERGDEDTARHQEQAPAQSRSLERGHLPDLGQPLLKATTPESDDYLPDAETALEEASVPQEPEVPAAVADESQPDTVERHVVLSPGIDLAGHEEYFFFDDVRYQADDAAAG